MTRLTKSKLNEELSSLIFERKSYSDQRFIQLLDKFPNTLQTKDFTGRTLLDIAVRYQRPAVVRYLVATVEADPTAIRSALINGFKDIEEILISRWPEHISEKQKIKTLLDSEFLAGLRDYCKRTERGHDLWLEVAR